MSRPMQIAVVVAVALVGFAGAFVALGGGSDTPPAGPTPTATAPGETDAATDADLAAQLGCRAPTRRDPSYEARLETQPDPPAAEGTTFQVLVSRDGQPVAGARVCLGAAMTDMAHGGASEEAREAAPRPLRRLADLPHARAVDRHGQGHRTRAAGSGDPGVVRRRVAPRSLMLGHTGASQRHFDACVRRFGSTMPCCGPPSATPPSTGQRSPGCWRMLSAPCWRVVIAPRRSPSGLSPSVREVCGPAWTWTTPSRSPS